MNKTRLLRNLFVPRQHQLDQYATDAEFLQRKSLIRLLKKGKKTKWGAEHGYDKILSYEQFAKSSPVNSYEELKDYIDRMRHGEHDVLWPGQVRWYAKSSGTTNDKSKFIPVSNDGLHDTHYRGGSDCVAWYLRNYPDSRIFDGRALILGGSHQPNYNLPHSLVGDLSAILIENINPLANLIRIPKKETALLADFEQKRERIAREAIGKDVTSLSGVPSWMLSVLTRVMEISGKEHLNEVWPNLEVFWHGGVAFTPYREQYHRLIDTPRMHYMETYNASEGFFGIQDDPHDPSMSLMLDYGVFYEFIPITEMSKVGVGEQATADTNHGTADSEALTSQSIVPLWEVEKGRNYAMVISTSSGLWRYLIGDTIRFTSLNPYKFVITGRTKSFINAFGEELIVDNAERGLDVACKATGAEIREYTAAPVFMNERGQCRHQWLVEFSREPDDLDAFAKRLDLALQTLNSDYEAKRYKDITLQCLEVIPARPGLFDDWLRSQGKLGGQHKVPRLSNDRHIIESILKVK